jgi:outer membrane protein assembly factor BamB
MAFTTVGRGPVSVGLSVLVACAMILGIAPQSSLAAGTPFVWSQFGFDDQHSSWNPFETHITSSNVHSLKRLYQVPLVSKSAPSVADGAPAFLGGVQANGLKDLLFLTTKDGWTLALDARTGKQLWGKQYGPNGCMINHDTARNETCYTTSSPAIDPNRQFVYGYGLDGYVHKYRVATGEEVQDSHWPELVTLKSFNEKGSSALSTATDRQGNSFLYVATSGYPGDAGDYQGHLTTINLSTGGQHVFNTLCSGDAAGETNDVHFAQTPATPDCGETQSAIWARPGVIHDPVHDRIYITTGNGAFDATNHHWGDSVLALHADGTGSDGKPLDSYTPVDQAQLNATDADLGSTAPSILPSIPGSAYPHLAVQGQKINRSNGAAELRLIDLDNLSQSPTVGPGNTGGDVGARYSLPQGGFLMTQPAVWVNPADPGKPWVFIGNEFGLVGLQVYVDSGSTVPTFHVGWAPVSSGRPSPVVANGILYYLSSEGIQALGATNGIQLWSDATVHNFHWESPIVANGVLYATDEGGHLTAYAPAPASTPKVKLTVQRVSKKISFRWQLSSGTGVAGFYLYAGQKLIHPSLIKVHAGLVYRHTVHQVSGTPVSAYAVRVVMNDGRRFSVQAT